MTTDRITTEEFHAMLAVETTRNKYGAKKCSADGHRFDSQVERDWYLRLKADPDSDHIDVHPVFTLPGGIRYTADFLVWRQGAWEPTPFDVKGMRPKTDFIRLWKLFATHPLAPLVVVSRKRGKWREMTDPEEARSW